MSTTMEKRASRSYGHGHSLSMGASAGVGGYIDAFENTQSRTFLKWLNTRLETANIEPMRDLARDLSDGVRLCQLMEIMSQSSLGRYNLHPKMRVQKAENVNKALQFIKGSGVVLTNIGPEDIIDGNLKLILGMIWTLILRFTIADINEEGLSAKEGLLLWCQRKTQGYADVDVQDFSRSWKDGLAFCALIHRHRPDLIDYDGLDKSDVRANTRLAFTVAAQHLNIPQLLDVPDVCDVEKPDDRSVMTYVAQYFHAFSVMDRADVLARRVTMFADTLETIWTGRNEYERKAQSLMASIKEKLAEWSGARAPTTYPEAKRASQKFAEYKKTVKRDWVGQKAECAALLGNIAAKVKTYDMKDYQPPPGLTLNDLDACWADLLTHEAQQSRTINANIRQIKENLRRRFADLANACEEELQNLTLELASLRGPLESQLGFVQTLLSRVSLVLSKTLPDIAAAEHDCEAANVEESDYTVYTFEDVEFEAKLVKDAIVKKKAFIDNQIVARTSTKLTPAQLEEFESTFRHFDRDQTNTLGFPEFTAALSALGIIYSDEDTLAIHRQLSELDQEGMEGRVTFQAFVDFLTDITEDQTSPDQVRESFAGIAQGKPYVTEMDLKVALVPQATISFLKAVMPSAPSAAGEASDREGPQSNGDPQAPGEPGSLLDYDAFLDSAFSS